jgi:DNA-directed RNA polymerase sigma subunit (sigma70/sigma32)
VSAACSACEQSPGGVCVEHQQVQPPSSDIIDASRESKRRIERILSTLTPKEREILKLRFAGKLP